MSHPAIFLDRDGTLIEDPGYLAEPADVQLFPGVPAALARAASAGYELVVVTNQSGVARGLLTEATLEAIHAELRRQLAAQGVRLAAIYACPYHPDGTVAPFNQDSPDRKPQPGMLRRAARDLDLDLRKSWMIGDSARDVEAGRRAGCRTIFLGDSAPPSANATPDHVAADLSAAIDIILAAPNSHEHKP